MLGKDHLERNKANTKIFMAAMGKYDITTLESMYTEDSIFWQMGYRLKLAGSHSMDETVKSLPEIYKRLPDGVEFDIFSMIAEGNKVAFEAESHGILSDGKPYDNQHHSALYFNDEGKVTEYRDYWDTLYAFENLFDGKPGEGTVVAESDKRLHFKTIFLLLKYLSPKNYIKRIIRDRKKMKEITDPVERNRANALAFIEAIGNMDMITLGTLYARDGIFWQPGKKLILAGPHSQGETANLVPRIYSRLPYGMDFDNYSVVAEGNKVAVESVTSSKLYNGNIYKNQYHFLFYFNDKGKITHFKEYWGTLHAFETLFENKTYL